MEGKAAAGSEGRVEVKGSLGTVTNGKIALSHFHGGQIRDTELEINAS